VEEALLLHDDLSINRCISTVHSHSLLGRSDLATSSANIGKINQCLLIEAN
jgi:hypothetical protein